MEVRATLAYEKLHQIGVGEGCNSQVFLINELQLGGVLVAKEIKKASFPSFDTYFREAKALFASRHSNVVSIHYACGGEDFISLVMPYFNEGSLSARICKNPLSLKELIRVSQGVLNGLHHIHLKNYVHLDIKPSNILFSDTNEPMIADFGQSGLLNQYGVVDSPTMYMFSWPPEVIQDSVATIESDIYLMGVTLYRAINGDAVFHNQREDISDLDDLADRIVAGKFPDRNLFLPHVPKNIKKIIKKSLNVDPEKRYRSAIELANALGNVPIPLDWQTEVYESGEMFWKASQGKDRADLVVELIKVEEDLWNVNVFTDNQGNRRKKTSHCREMLNRRDAETHLGETFSVLAALVTT